MAMIGGDTAGMTRPPFLPVAATLLALLALAACTSGPPPVWQRLTDADAAIMADTVQRALETAKLGEGVNWANAASGHRGTVTPVRTTEAAGDAPCRTYQLTATADGDTAIGYDTACRDAAGAWLSETSASEAGDDPRNVLRAAERRIYDRYYDDWRCRHPYRPGAYDPWCGWPRSGVTFGVGTGF